jgi:outer membrane protein assembly factor BamE (lipoprotein component of BamABCDE complex)
VLRRYALSLVPALLAAGCAGFNSLPPGTSAQQVQARVGAPSSVRKTSDGSEVWEYPLGPLGTETYMVTLGPDHAVREVRQVLTEATISKLKVGMPRDEVRGMLGRPAGVSYSNSDNDETWYWRYREWNIRKMELYVRFDGSTGELKELTRFQIDTSDGKRQ